MKIIKKVVHDNQEVTSRMGTYQQGTLEEIIKLACDQFNVKFDEIISIDNQQKELKHTTEYSITALVLNKKLHQHYLVNVVGIPDTDGYEDLGTIITEDGQRFRFGKVAETKSDRLVDVLLSK